MITRAQYRGDDRSRKTATMAGRQTESRVYSGKSSYRTSSSFLVELEAHFNADLYGHGLTILGCRLKTPLLNRFDGLLVKTHAKPALNSDVMWLAVRANNHSQNASSFVFRLTGLLRVLRVRCSNWFRRQHSAAHAKYAATNTATSTLSDAWARAFPD